MNLQHALDPTVAFVGVEPTVALRDFVIAKIGSLLGKNVLACRVVLEASHHSHTADRFRAKVEIDLPHRKIVVGSGDSFGDLYAAVDAAASDAKVALHEDSRRQRTHRREA